MSQIVYLFEQGHPGWGSTVRWPEWGQGCCMGRMLIRQKAVHCHLSFAVFQYWVGISKIAVNLSEFIII